MTQPKLKVGIDVDDVLLNTLETAWLPEFNELMGFNIKPTDITEWDISKFVPTMYKRAIYDVLALDSTWDRVQPVRDSRKYLKKLNDNPNVELYIISATSILTTQHKWDKFFEYYPFIDPKQVITMFNKQLLPPDMLLVDDNCDNLQMWGILFARPHNKICIDTPRFRQLHLFRLDSWERVYNNIIERINY